jgi:hypothetical protein
MKRIGAAIALAVAVTVCVVGLSASPAQASHRCPASYSINFPTFFHIRTNAHCSTVRGIEYYVRRYWRDHHRFPRRVRAAHHWWRARYVLAYNVYDEPYERARFTWSFKWVRASLGS